MRNTSDNHLVVVVATPAVPVFELSIPCEVFGVDRHDVSPDWYDFALVAPDARTVTSSGMTVPPGRGLAACEEADTLIVPACSSVHTAAPPEVVSAIRAAHQRGARIVSFCSGAFVLAEAGVLDGRRATTHWMHADELAARYPRIDVDPTVLYVHDEVWTGAGSAAGLDLCIELVRRDLGAAVANEVARRIVVPPHRDGGQAQFIRPRPVHPESPGLDDLMHWARANLDTVTVTALAARANVSGRTLHRMIRAQTGRAPQSWLHGERIRAAQELLETTDLTIDAIAARTGLGSATNLRGHFTGAVGVPPSAYRATFGTARGGSSREGAPSKG